MEAMLCPRCNADVMNGLAQCPDCGAPMTGLRVLENPSTDVQPELARGNLARMRGHYGEAEQICLGILSRYPHNVEAHVLIGDIFADQEKFEQACQWYELALDLEPDSFSTKQKQQLASDRIRAREALSTTQQLGLAPSAGWKTGHLAAAVLAMLLICGFLAYTFGQNSSVLQGSPVVRVPILATPDSAARLPEPVDELASTAVAAAPTSPTAPREDRLLLEQLARGPWGQRLVGAHQDPRTKQLFLTLPTNPGEIERHVAAEMAREALNALPEAVVVTVRVFRDGALTYVADVPRARLAETLTDPWRQSVPGDDSWIAHVLTNEWHIPPPPDEPPKTP